MFTAPFDMYFKGLESLGQGMGPMKGLARWQLEVAGFANRRVQAYMEIPTRLSRCRTPQDLMNEQTRFWQTSFQQYQESSRRIMDAWAQVATPMGFTAQGSEQNDRDYITFSEPQDANGRDRSQHDRHAA